MKRSTSNRGFTLIETVVAASIVVVAVLAMLSAQQTFHQQYATAAERATGMLLANEIRELAMEMELRDPTYGTFVFGPESDEANADALTALQAFDDVDDFAGSDGSGMVFDPPVTALRQQVPNMNGWQQVVTVENVSPDDIDGPAVADHSTDLVRMTVQVLHQEPGRDQPMPIARLTWVTAGQPN